MDGGREVGVAAPADAAARHDRPRARRIQVGDQRAGVQVGDDGSLRHFENEVRAVLAEHILAAAVPAALGLVPVPIAEVQQRRQVRIHDEDDAAAASPVAAVRPAARHELLLAERDHPVAAAARLRLDFDFVHKHGLPTSLPRRFPCVTENGVL
jgi:hypothetical protein